jgi:hypothetical protein
MKIGDAVFGDDVVDTSAGRNDAARAELPPLCGVPVSVNLCGVPVSVNEFGVMRWVPNAADFMRDEMELFEQRGMNHALWV